MTAFIHTILSEYPEDWLYFQGTVKYPGEKLVF